MKVNIYYGGRGLIDDPTIYVINKIQDVLEELRVNVSRYNLYELKNNITTLPQTLKDCNAVILATTVEWLGIGGYMQQFLDACWLYGDKSKISEVYMFPVVMAKTYGEREAVLTLTSAWEMLGGKSCNGLSGYIDETTDFEFNQDYAAIIEKKAEEVYRTVSQKMKMLPSSNNAIKKNILRDTVRFTPQESEQLSKYASNDNFVQTQKKDIEELASMFKDMLDEEERGGDLYYTEPFGKAYVPQSGVKVSYYFMIDDKNKDLVVSVENESVNAYMGKSDTADVIGKMSRDTFDKVITGHMTLQRAFMSGEMTAKGNMKNIRLFDDIFKFS